MNVQSGHCIMQRLSIRRNGHLYRAWQPAFPDAAGMVGREGATTKFMGRLPQQDAVIRPVTHSKALARERAACNVTDAFRKKVNYMDMPSDRARRTQTWECFHPKDEDSLDGMTSIVLLFER